MFLFCCSIGVRYISSLSSIAILDSVFEDFKWNVSLNRRVRKELEYIPDPPRPLSMIIGLFSLRLFENIKHTQPGMNQKESHSRRIYIDAKESGPRDLQLFCRFVGNR